jgi:hypothetical protein
MGRIKAGKAPGLLRPANDLSPPACLTMRFDGDSSISGRIACRSSVADTTGNSSIRTQLRSKKGRIRSKGRRSWSRADSRSHIQTAGTAKVSQKRLSNNSICTPEQLNRNNEAWRMVRLSVYEDISLAKYGIQVNVNARTCTVGSRKALAIPCAVEGPRVLPTQTEKALRPSFLRFKIVQLPSNRPEKIPAPSLQKERKSGVFFKLKAETHLGRTHLGRVIAPRRSPDCSNPQMLPGDCCARPRRAVRRSRPG